MAHNNLVAIMFSALVLGALTECTTSTSSCASVDPEMDATTLLQAEATAERHLATSQNNKKHELMGVLGRLSMHAGYVVVSLSEAELLPTADSFQSSEEKPTLAKDIDEILKDAKELDRYWLDESSWYPAGPETDAIPLLQAEAIAEKHFATSRTDRQLMGFLGRMSIHAGHAVISLSRDELRPTPEAFQFFEEKPTLAQDIDEILKDAKALHRYSLQVLAR